MTEIQGTLDTFNSKSLIFSSNIHHFNRRYLCDQEWLEGTLGIWDHWRETKILKMKIKKIIRLAADTFDEVGV